MMIQNPICPIRKIKIRRNLSSGLNPSGIFRQHRMSLFPLKNPLLSCFRLMAAAGVAVLFFVFPACQSSQILLSPLPARIDSFEGYASIRINSPEATARSKFSFLFQLPDKAWIEVRGFLGRTLYQIVIDRNGAYFVLPSKKAFWQGPEEEIIDKFLGFQVTLDDMLSLFFGRWNHPGLPEANRAAGEGWLLLKRDAFGRIIEGRKGDLVFSIGKFIDKTPFAKELSFTHAASKGQIKILKIRLNEPIRKKLFEKSFLKRFARKTWPEIQDILNHNE